MENRQIAQDLLRSARQLAEANENLFRVKAYRRAAWIIEGLDRPIADDFDPSGRLRRKVPGIGRSLSRTIAQMIRGGDPDSIPHG